jgi:transposase InsO family protein
VTDIDEQWQLDLADVSKLKKDNDGYTFLLCAIDVLSKYAWVVPIHQKTGKEMMRTLRQIFKDERRPVRMQSDQGKQFTNRELRQAFKSIHFFTTRNTETKASIVERFHRTLKARMWRYFTKQKTTLRGCLTRPGSRSYHFSLCGTIKIPPSSKALSAEHTPKFCSPSPAMLTSPYK